MGIVRFRDAKKQDLSAMYAMLEAPEINEADYLSYAEKELDQIEKENHQRKRMIVATNGRDEPIAFLRLIAQKDKPLGTVLATVEAVRTRPDLRGQDIGKKLMEYAESEARKAGYKVMVFEPVDDKALAFYLKTGYEIATAMDVMKEL